jgi:tetratricopeptide (TPR) repeat protein
MTPTQDAFSLAVASLGEGQLAEAEDLCRQVLAADPNHAGAWHLFGLLAQQAGQPLLAIDLLRQSIALDKGQPVYWASLGAAFANHGRFSEAVDAYRRAVELSPQDADIWHRMGNSISWSVLAHVYLQLGRFAQAEDACRRALAIDPRLVLGRIQLVESLFRQWRLKEAEQQARGIVADEPTCGEGWRSLGLILGLLGAQDESLEALYRAVALQPDAATHSRLLSGLQYREGIDAAALFEAHKKWADAHERPLPPVVPLVSTGTTQRKLRLGFISSDFCCHAVGLLVLPVLEHLDKSSCSIVCYADGPQNDVYTARFRAAADEWR